MRSANIWWLVTGTLAWLLIGLILVGWHAFDDDEFQHLRTAWLVANGQVPYRDFFEHHLILYHLLLAPLAATCGDPLALFVVRGLDWLIGIGCAGLLVSLGQRKGIPVWIGILAATLWLATPMVGYKLAEIRPAGAALLCMAAAIWCLDREAATIRRSIVVGLLLGCMVLLSQKFIYVALGVGAALLMAGRPRTAIVTGLTALAVGAGYALGMWLWGAWDGFWRFAVVMNAEWKRNVPVSIYLSEWYLSAPVILIGAGGGAMLALRDAREHAALLGATVGGLALILLVPVPFRQAFLPLTWCATLLLAMLAAPALERMRFKRVQALVVLSAFAPALVQHGRQWADNTGDLALRSAVDERFPSGPIYDGRGRWWDRPMVGFHPIIHEGILLMLDQERYSEEVVDALAAAGWPPVVRDYRIEQLPAHIQSCLVEHYRPDPQVPQLLVPGFVVSRSRLRVGTTIELPRSGLWRVTWSGAPLQLDGKILVESGLLELEAGPHHLQARGFVRDVSFNLERLDAH